MLPKIILVMYLITGQNGVQLQLTAKYATEEACQAEAKKHNKDGGWYPVQKAVCTIDATAPKATK